ncbi:molybdopterin-dependent oxidoreductase [Kitasatospora sp. MAP5-34]|uniref:molybdopterin-dependent oxidoreductase n=1 Tax=Kitasatospora sp. MAP5-34 TaxID=3035102 RepID=UPI0024772BCC|nr:molybdopterin-dependent oxidoreductase [Kitasatospora sp. MAP5-34]MDH6576104.1 DMSO/TMAO reductase YedYZ molybdopterin-dependent catalytic subunit [Kitasatospora sp. MAP5-34]
MTGRVATRAVHLHGLLDHPADLTVEQLRAMPSHRAEVSFDCLGSGQQRHSFEGPLLWDVLRAARPQVDFSRRKPRLRHVLAVTGADGHLAVISWAEIDPDFGGQRILLATSIDGEPLDAVGPQLVIPADACGARYVSGITAIRIDAVAD